MVGAVYYKAKKWNHMHFRRVERGLANRAPCFLWFFGFIVWDQEQQGVPIAGLKQILPGLTSAILHCWCPGQETNSIHLHVLVSFLLHSLLTFPSLHLHIITINTHQGTHQNSLLLLLWIVVQNLISILPLHCFVHIHQLTFWAPFWCRYPWPCLRRIVPTRLALGRDSSGNGNPTNPLQSLVPGRGSPSNTAAHLPLSQVLPTPVNCSSSLLVGREDCLEPILNYVHKCFYYK